MVGAYLLFRSPVIQTRAIQWITEQLSNKLKAKITIGGVNISLFKSVVLEDLLIEDQQHDTLFFVKEIDLKIDSLNFSKRDVHFDALKVNNPQINIQKGATGYNYDFLLGNDTTKADAPKKWDFNFIRLDLLNARIKYRDRTTKDTIMSGVNFNNLDIAKLNVSIEEIHPSHVATTFVLKNGSFSEKSGFSIRNIQFNGKIDTTGFEMTNMTIGANHSHIEASKIKISPNEYYGIDSLYADKSTTLSNRYIVDCNFKESMISLIDLSYVIPEIWGMNEPILFSGGLKGSLSNLKFKNVNVKIGKETQVNADLELRGLPEWKNTYIFFKLYNNKFNFNDLAAIRLPDNTPQKYLKIPKALTKDVRITYQGNFAGFPSDFVAYGTFDGSLGKLSTDVAIRPQKIGVIDFSGNIKASSFNIGKILDYEPLGAITLDIKVKGTKRENNNFDAFINGNIDSLYFNHTRIDSIYVDGEAKERSFEGKLKIEDQNLKMAFEGKADFEKIIPEFNFSSTVTHANLVGLGVDNGRKNSDIHFDVRANFSGNNIDNINGEIKLKEFLFIRDEQRLEIQNLIFNTLNSPDKNQISLDSDIADASITGKYHFGEFDLTFRDYLHHFLPSAKLPFSDRKSMSKNAFQYNIRIKKAEELSRFLVPGLSIKSPVVLSGTIDSEKKTFTLDGIVNEILFNQNQVLGLSLNSRNIGNKWIFRVGADNARIGSNINLENFSINNALVHDSLTTAITWNNTGNPTYSGKVDFLGIFSKNKAGNNLSDFYLSPSKIWIADSLWQIEKSHLHIDTTAIRVDNFKIHHGEEEFKIFGNVANNSTDKINIEFKKVRLRNLDLLPGEKIGIDGELNGNASIADPYHSFGLTSDLKLTDFIYLEKNFGDVTLENTWDQEKKQLNTSLNLAKDGKAGFELKGFYHPATDSINYNATFSNYQLESLLPILNSFANYVDGTGNGKVSITGKLDAPKFNGNVAVSNTKIGIDYTKVVYSFSDTVRFAGDSIIFKNIILSDVENNKARLNGYLTHNLFSQMRYNLVVRTNNLLALNTNSSDNNLFYGTAHAAGEAKITGLIADVKLDMSLTTRPGTQISVPLENPESVSEYNFIRFVNPDTLYYKNKPLPIISNSDGFEMNLNLTATPDAKIQMLFNSTVGDAISGYGSGDLRFSYDKDGNFFIYGDYDIDKGDYIFTIQNVLLRKFHIENGGVISWNGDPYGAIVDLNATYNIKAPISELLLSNIESDNTRRIAVECKINLSKKLLNPAVRFGINFPTVDDRTKDELQQFISTQDDINRQMVSLMVMGQFYTPEYLRGRQDFQSTTSSIVGSTTSDILSNQLSNWLSQISQEWDIGFNYQPGDQVNTNQMELALSTQILNDRVTINGNIGNNANVQSNTSNPVVGEIELFVKLNKSGKLQLKAYNRANDDLIYDTSLYKQGIGLSFSEEFDTLGELFGRYNYKRKRTNNSAIPDSLKRRTIR